MSDITLDANGDVVLDQNGQTRTSDAVDPVCCVEPYCLRYKCCFNDEIELTFDTLTDAGSMPGSPVQEGIDWIVANFSASSIVLSSPGACASSSWLYYSTILYTDATHAFFLKLDLAFSGSGGVNNILEYSMYCQLSRIPIGTYVVGNPVGDTTGEVSVGQFFINTTGTSSIVRAAEVTDSVRTYADCCGGKFGSASINVWNPFFITASTAANGLILFDTGQDDECESVCDIYDDCYQIAGYVDGDIEPCVTCQNSADTPWDGVFTRNLDPSVPDQCFWLTPGSQATGSASISGKRLRLTALHKRCGVWTMQISCGTSVGGPYCLIWSGVQSGGTSPDGVYVRTCGVDQTASFTIEACPP